MAQMTHCSGCQKHYFRRETACPHCGETARTGPVRAFVRQAKMGGLMLFTALTTTACYGTPPMIDGPAGVSPPGYEQPEPKVPSTPGTAFVFLQGKDGEPDKETMRLQDATIEGRTLSLRSTNGRVRITIEAADDAAFQPAQGVQASIPIASLKALTVLATLDSSFRVEAPSEVEEGYLQISRLDEETIGGTFRVEKDGQVLDFYFLANR